MYILSLCIFIIPLIITYKITNEQYGCCSKTMWKTPFFTKQSYSSTRMKFLKCFIVFVGIHKTRLPFLDIQGVPT